MYVPIFVEKTFNSRDEIIYVTEPLNVVGFKAYTYDLQLRELNRGTIVTLHIEHSGTGDYDETTDWALLGNPTSNDAEGHRVFTASEFANWIRFKLIINNPTGRSGAKVSLTGHLTRRN